MREEGTYEETQAVAIKRVVAWALADQMEKKNLTKSEMAARMETSRSQLDRLLDPEKADVKPTRWRAPPAPSIANCASNWWPHKRRRR